MPPYDLKPASPSRPQGTTGLRNNAGYIREDFISDLNGIRGREVFYEMSMNDAVVGSVGYAVRNLMRGVKWRVVPIDEDDERAVEAAELVEGMLFEDMSVGWADAIGSACSMFTYGFAILEPIMKKRNGRNRTQRWKSSKFNDGLWGIDRLASRSQRSIDRWIYDNDENLLGFVQTPYNGRQRSINMNAVLHFRTTTELDNPEGVSLLRNAYRSWYWLKRLQELEGIGIERDLVGMPTLYVPGELLDHTSDDPVAHQSRAMFEEMLRNVRRDTQEGIILPSDKDDAGNDLFHMELMSTGGSRQFDIDTSIQRYEKRIAMTVLGDFVFVGLDGSGSLALAETKTRTFASAVEAYQAHMAGVFNDQLIPKIWGYNGFDEELMPHLEPGKLLAEDLAQLGEYITKLAGVGFDLATDVELEQRLRAAAELPPVPDRTAIVDDLGLPADMGMPGGDDFDDGTVVPIRQATPEPEPDADVQDDPAPVRKSQTIDLDPEAMVRAMKEAAGL